MKSTLTISILILLFCFPIFAEKLTYETSRLLTSDSVSQHTFGASMAISGDTAVIGSLMGTVSLQPGRVDIYSMISGDWAYQSRIIASDGFFGDSFGSAIALEDNLMVVGAFNFPGEVSGQGAVYIFRRTNGIWQQEIKIMVSDCTSFFCNFGRSVAIENGEVFVGAPGQTVGGLRRGSVYVYGHNGTNWYPKQQIVPVAPTNGSDFGESISVSMDTLVVGAWGDDVGGVNNLGSATVYSKQGDSWVFNRTLVAPDGTAGEHFGMTVAIENTRILVACPNDRINDIGNRGSVYYFERIDGNWNYSSKFVASDGVFGDQFGNGSLVFSGNKAFVGVAARQINQAFSQGTVYAFELVGSDWIERKQLRAFDGAAQDRFGAGLAVDGDRVFVCARNKPLGQLPSHGAVYFFTSPFQAPSLDLDTQSDSGISSVDNITNHPSLGFTITELEIGATVTVMRDTQILLTFTAQASSAQIVDNNPPPNVTVFYSVRQVSSGQTSSPGGLFVSTDTLAPTPTLAQAPGQHDPTQYQPVSFRVTFNESVFGQLLASNVSLAGSTANVSNAQIVIVPESNYWTIQVSELLTEGAVRASILPGPFVDVAGNSSLASVSNDNSVTVDLTGPFVTVNQAADQSDPGSTPVRFTVVLNEPISGGLHSSHFVLNGSTANTTFSNITITGSGTVFTASVSLGLQTTGTVVLSVPAGRFSDLAGNTNFASTSTDNAVTVETIRPDVVINQAPGQADPTTSEPVRFEAQFSEPVVGIMPSRISLAGSTANVSRARVDVSGSGTSYTISVSNVGPPGGYVRVSLPAFATTDLLGNGNNASTSTDNSVVVFGSILDGSIERNTNNGLNPFWTSTSTWFGTALCTRFTCGTGNDTAAPRTGDGWIWFDGAPQSMSEIATASQNVLFPDQGPVGLAYYLRVGSVSPPTSSVMLVKVDGVVVDTVFEPATPEAGYSRRSVDVTNFADGNFHVVSFEYSRQSQGVGDNFTIDDISLVEPITTLQNVPFDFDGDSKTDLGIYRPNGVSGSEWWYQRSSNGSVLATQFGAPTDRVAAADYTGDGKTDVAFWRPATGFWYVLRSEDNSFYAFPFGANGDTPVPGDYDADGKADVAVFRGSDTTWYIQRSSDNGTTIQQFGVSGDVPVNADYDGDGKADIAIYRPSLGQWWLMRSSAGTVAYQFGSPTDKTVVGDYTGDGMADVAFWRPSSGEWFVLRSEDNSFFGFPFGISTDTPVPGDYDGDGRNDAGVFRSSNNTWYIQRTTAGTLIQQFGATGDVPLPSAFVR